VPELRKRIGEQAKAEPNHRFWGLYTHVWKLDTLEEAYRLAKENNGAPGMDGVTFAQIEADGLPEFLATLSQELREKSYRPLPCRRVDIPKEGGKVRQLRIPAIRDRVVQGALKLILEPIFEADFQEGSFGYRPNRTAHEALERVRRGLNYRLHNVIDLDLKSYLDASSHCTSICRVTVKEAWQRVWNLDSKAFSAPAADVHGSELTALYTLQDGLARNAENTRGIDHGNVSLGGLSDKKRAQFLCHADAPRSARSELLAGDETVVEPAVHRRGSDAEKFCGSIDGRDLAVLFLWSGLETRDLPMRAQAADAIGGEAHTCSGGLALAIQDARDDGVGVVDRKTSHEVNDIVARANRCRTRTRQRYVELGEETAMPAHREMSFFVVAFDIQEDLFDKRPQKLLSVAIGCGWSGPYLINISAQRQNGGTLLGGDGNGRALLPTCEIGFRGTHLLQTLFPFCLEASRHEAVFWVDSAIATLGPLCFVASAFDLKSKLRNRSIFVGFELFGGRDCGLEPGGGESL
jgi:hypothetical protein